MPLVLDQGPALAVSHVAFVVDAMLGANIIAAHLEGIVDCVDDNGLEIVLSLGDQSASLEEVLPFIGWDFENFQMVEAGFALAEYCVWELGRKTRFANFRRAVDQNRLLT